MIMSKELAFVYIVDGEKFLDRKEAVDYMNKVNKKKSQGDENDE